MAKKQTKVIVSARGDVSLRRASGHHLHVGRVAKLDGGWQSCSSFPPRTHSDAPVCTKRKTKAAAVLHVVNRWRSWIGLPRGRTDY